MTVYQLLFILLFFGSVAAVIIAWVLALKQWPLARRLLLGLASVWAVYLAMLVGTDATARQSVTRAGDDRCFDEMCFAVVSAETMHSASAHFDDVRYTVTVRATSHSGGRAQAEGGLRGRLYEDGRFFDVSGAAQQASEVRHATTGKLTQKLAPGESVLCVLVFEVPRTLAHPALTLDHGFTPGFFVIGESPFFHEPDVLELPAALGT